MVCRRPSNGAFYASQYSVRVSRRLRRFRYAHVLAGTCPDYLAGTMKNGRDFATRPSVRRSWNDALQSEKRTGGTRDPADSGLSQAVRRAGRRRDRPLGGVARHRDAGSPRRDGPGTVPGTLRHRPRARRRRLGRRDDRDDEGSVVEGRLRPPLRGWRSGHSSSGVRSRRKLPGASRSRRRRPWRVQGREFRRTDRRRRLLCPGYAHGAHPNLRLDREAATGGPTPELESKGRLHSPRRRRLGRPCRRHPIAGSGGLSAAFGRSRQRHDPRVLRLPDGRASLGRPPRAAHDSPRAGTRGLDGPPLHRLRD